MDWQPSEPIAFAAAVSSFAAARATHLASQSTFAVSCRTLATTISEEAKAQGNEVATRAEFSLFFVKVLLATPALAAAYTELERAAFARFLTPAHARRGVKLTDEERRSGQRATNHLGYRASLPPLSPPCHLHTLHTHARSTNPSHTHKHTQRSLGSPKENADG
jgi:hypothetical protein